MKKVDATIVIRAITLATSGVMLISIFVEGSHSSVGLFRAILELALLLIAIASAHSWGQRHGRSEVIDCIDELGHHDLADELWKRAHSQKGFASTDLDDTNQGSVEALLKNSVTTGDADRRKESNDRNKLTDEERKRIPKEAMNSTHEELASRYGVSRQYISRLCKAADGQKDSASAKFWKI